MDMEQGVAANYEFKVTKW